MVNVDEGGRNLPHLFIYSMMVDLNDVEYG